MFRLKGTFIFVLATVSIFFRKADANNIGIAFSGGGFKSVADQTALTAGLLAELMKRNEDLRKNDLIESPLASSKLYKNVKSLSTISGGSWFTSYLVYSIKFRQMVEKMAEEEASGAKAGTIKDTFFDEYGKRFDALRRSNKNVNDIQKLFILMDQLISQFADTFPFLRTAVDNIKNGVRTALTFSQIGSDGGPQSSWYTITKNILGDDINQMTLGSEVQEWSKGKSWNIITSATTASDKPIIPVLTPTESDIWVDATNLNTLSYTTTFNQYTTAGENISRVLFVPVLFSVVLGDEGSPPAPLKPEKIYSVPENLQLTYNGSTGRSFSNWRPAKFSKTIERGIQPMRNDNDSFADMLIVGPVAASSAAIGFASILPKSITGLLTQVLKLNPAVGFACKAKDPFSIGQKLIDKLWNKNSFEEEDFDDMAKNGVCNFVDGGATDPFGIATALASGANEIFCVNAIPDIVTVNETHFGDDPFDINPIPKPFQIPIFEKDGPFATFHIFEKEGAAPTEQDEFLSADDAVVKDMLYQTFKVKTVKNVYFGIEEGREVTLHVFSAQSTKLSSGDIVAGQVDSFEEIGEYIETIMATFAKSKNSGIVNKMLMALGALKGGLITGNDDTD